MIIIQKECPNCGNILEVGIDLSEGPPNEAGVECDNCFATPTWKVDWAYDVWLSDYLYDDSKKKENKG